MPYTCNHETTNTSILAIALLQYKRATQPGKIVVLQPGT